MTVMSLDELSRMPALTAEEIKLIDNAKPTPSDDCPAMSQDELKQFRPWYDCQKEQLQ